jgi:hypothetical protein
MEKFLKLLKEVFKDVDGVDWDAIEKSLGDEVKGEVEKATTPLSVKRDEVLAEKKKLQNRLKLFDGVDIEAYNKLKGQIEDLELKEVFEVGDLEAVKTALTSKHQAELDGLQAQLSSADTFISTLLVDQGLTDNLLKANVSERYLPAVKALLKDGVQINTNETGVRTAVVGELSLNEYVEKWAVSDEGKNYITAQQNSGGGAGGGSGSAGNTGKARFDELMGKDELSPSESVELNTLAEEIKAEQDSDGGN